MEKIIQKYNNNELTIKQLQEQNKEIKEKLQNFLVKSGNRYVEVEDDESETKVTLVESTKLKFDLNKLKAKLDVKTFKEITDLNIEIDRAELKERFEKYPNLRKQIGSALVTYRTLNESKLNELLKNEQLDDEEIEGTYEVNKTKYLRIIRKFAE